MKIELYCSWVHFLLEVPPSRPAFQRYRLFPSRIEAPLRRALRQDVRARLAARRTSSL
jgi:hypothetical protein